MCTAVVVMIVGFLPTPKPSPPPTLRRVAVERNGTNNTSASGLKFQMVDEPAGAGFRHQEVERRDYRQRVSSSST